MLHHEVGSFNMAVWINNENTGVGRRSGGLGVAMTEMVVMHFHGLTLTRNDPHV